MVQAVEDTTAADYLTIVGAVMDDDMVALAGNPSVKAATQPAVVDNKVVH